MPRAKGVKIEKGLGTTGFDGLDDFGVGEDGFVEAGTFLLGPL